jgi:hypothetical protein
MVVVAYLAFSGTIFVPGLSGASNFSSTYPQTTHFLAFPVTASHSMLFRI